MRNYLIITVIGLLSACSPGSDDHFLIKRDGALMPVWIHGDVSSKTYILTVPGSGASGRFYHWLEAFKQLEKNYAIVYWDQRGSGLSHGNPEGDTMTLNDFVLDLELLIDTLNVRHSPEQIVLLGHSLGGGVSSGYLLEAQRRKKVTAYIDIAGVRSYQELYDSVRNEMLNMATVVLNDGLRSEDHELWQEIQQWYINHTNKPDPLIGGEEAEKHADYESVLQSEWGFDYQSWEKDFTEDINREGRDDTISGPFNYFTFVFNNQHYYDTFDFESVNIGFDQMSAVDIPSLFIGGVYDLVTSQYVTASSNALGTPDKEKTLVFFESSAHFPMYDEPDRFVTLVKSFLDKY